MVVERRHINQRPPWKMSASAPAHEDKAILHESEPNRYVTVVTPGRPAVLILVSAAPRAAELQDAHPSPDSSVAIRSTLYGVVNRAIGRLSAETFDA
jgi:hypothetical protein